MWAGAGYSAFAAIAANNETLTVSFVNIHGTYVRAYAVFRIIIKLSEIRSDDNAIMWDIDIITMQGRPYILIPYNG